MSSENLEFHYLGLVNLSYNLSYLLYRFTASGGYIHPEI